MKRARLPRLFLALAAGLTIGGVLGGLLAAGAIESDGPDRGRVPPAKRTVEAAEAAAQATAEAGYHAPKPTPGTPAPTVPHSCPIDESTLKTGIFEGAPYQPPPDPSMRAIHVVSEAFPAGANDGKLYGLYLGYPDTSPFYPDRTPDPEHGLIVVSGPGSKDPCAAGEPPVLLAGASRLNVYPLPFTGTPARFTQIDGTSVTFETVDGRSGRFDFITRAFSDEGS